MIDRAMKPFVKPFNCHFALTTIGYEKKAQPFYWLGSSYLL